MIKPLDRQVKVYLPVSVPDVLNEILENIIVERGKMTEVKASFFEEYYFIGNMEGNYIFTDLSFGPDGIFSALKLLEMLAKTKMSFVCKV